MSIVIHETHIGSAKGECPNCGHPFSRVVNSRGNKRTRECAQCQRRWHTRETFEAYVYQSTRVHLE